ncbi:hypothetical protein TanjilG_25082 [Lupinus angustifolius]|uniref:CCT domain-containing protein n=1 Tax=Lupinus angustifolius TaxID=3871 RepID=A0A394DC48_LUPAN|nr:hypothetical protein TanjilG_25082 [Lupinus angustifolius]
MLETIKTVELLQFVSWESLLGILLSLRICYILLLTAVMLSCIIRKEEDTQVGVQPCEIDIWLHLVNVYPHFSTPNTRFDKRVRYASRKERVDVRRRVKGRFVKVGDAYDYDPMGPTRSY